MRSFSKWSIRNQLVALLTILVAGLTSLNHAWAQSSPALEVGDFAKQGVALRVSCEGSQRVAFLATAKDMENAYSRALGQAGKVPRLAFTAEGNEIFLALERVKAVPSWSIQAGFWYRITPVSEAAKKLSTLLREAKGIQIGRLKATLDARGSSSVLDVLDVHCPF